LQLLPERPSVVTLCDVIEHIPENSRLTLLRQLADMGAQDVRILLTFPTKYYQDFLRREHPEELQIIDNSISSERLAQEAAEAGLSMTFFKTIDVWRKVQYVHSILERDVTLELRAPAFVQGSTRTAVPLWGKLIRRYRRKKYIDNVFGSSQLLPTQPLDLVPL
jgi:hypothetical protein